jgi:hypothetical protein
LLVAVALLAIGETWFEVRMRRELALADRGGSVLTVLTRDAPGVALGLDRLEPLIEHCASRGWSVVASDSAIAPPMTAAVALVDPWGRLDPRETAALLEYVRGGGRLLLFLGARGAIGELATRPTRALDRHSTRPRDRE